jgi:hypothetical protein
MLLVLARICVRGEFRQGVMQDRHVLIGPWSLAGSLGPAPTRARSRHRRSTMALSRVSHPVSRKKWILRQCDSAAERQSRWQMRTDVPVAQLHGESQGLCLGRVPSRPGKWLSRRSRVSRPCPLTGGYPRGPQRDRAAQSAGSRAGGTSQPVRGAAAAAGA